MANQSKYTFSEVEKKLDIIKDNQGSNKVLLGDGTYGEKPKDGTDGEDGVGIGNISKTNTVGLVDTYTITFTDGNTTTFTITNGKNGTDGVGIVSVQKTATNGLVDTYAITFTDKSTSTFEVTNGADGSGNSVSEEQIATAVEEYLTANPPSGVSQSDIEDAVADYMTENADSISSLTDEQKEKLDAIILDGDGKSVLSNNGSYIDFNESGIDLLISCKHTSDATTGNLIISDISSTFDKIYKALSEDKNVQIVSEHATYGTRNVFYPLYFSDSFIVFSNATYNGTHWMSDCITLTSENKITTYCGIFNLADYSTTSEVEEMINAVIVNDEQITSAVETYLTENPVEEITDEEIIKVIESYLNTEVYTEIVETGVGFDADGSVAERTDSDGITDYIPVRDGDTIIMSAFPNNDDSLVTIVLYDINKNILSCTSTGDIPEGYLDTSNDFTQDFPLVLNGWSEACYIRVCKWTNAPCDFKVTVERENLKIESAIEDYLEENLTESNETDILDGKKILFVGDSICEGVGASGQPYPYWIQQWHENVTIYNLGVAGMTVAQKDTSITNAMPVRIANGEFENTDYSDVDIIVFEGGINDLMNNVKLGYIQNSYNIEKYNTFCRGMEYMFSYFKELFPKARMIFLSTHYVTAYDYNKSKAWWGAASEICAKWGIEFLDLFSLMCTAKISGLQLHPDYAVHRDYYAKYLNMALVSDTPLAGARTTNYYKHNAPCMLSYYSGTKSFNVGDTISTSDWRINMVRADLTTYVNVSNIVTYDLSDVNSNEAGTYPIHVAYTEDGITLSIDVDVTITSENAEKTLDNITATKTTTSYSIGREINTDDITVTANYSDSSTADVTANAEFDTSNINNSVAGEYNIAITYTEGDATKTTAIQITIVENGATTVIANGTANDKENKESVVWTLDSEGVMTFDATTSNTTIATYADAQRPWYSNLKDIKKVVFSSNIVETGGNVLLNATSLTEVEFKNDIAISASAFKGCSSLSTIDLTKATYIGNNGLANCGALPNEIILGATALAAQAFYYQSQITSIKFTGTPTSVASDAFSSVTGWNSSANLTDIYVPWAEDEVENAPWGASSATIHYNTTT